MIRIDAPPAPWWRPVRRRLRRWRRRAAIMSAAVAAAVLATQVVYAIRPDTVDVVVVRRPVAAGATVTVEDVALSPWPTMSVPPAALRRLDQAVGLTSAGPLSSGEVLTPPRLAAGDHAVGDLTGRVLVVVGLADAWSVAVVTTGSLVDVHAPAAAWLDGAAPPTDGPLARGAVVVRVLGAAPDSLDASPPGDALTLSAPADARGSEDPAQQWPGAWSGVDTGAALVLGVHPNEAADLAGLAGQGLGISTAPQLAGSE